MQPLHSWTEYPLGIHYLKAENEGLRGELGGWSGAEIQLGIISVTVEIESMMSDDLAEGEHVNGEQHTTLYIYNTKGLHWHGHILNCQSIPHKAL